MTTRRLRYRARRPNSKVSSSCLLAGTVCLGSLAVSLFGATAEVFGKPGQSKVRSAAVGSAQVVWTSRKVGWIFDPLIIPGVGRRWHCVPTARRTEGTETLCRTTDGGRHWSSVFAAAAARVPPKTGYGLATFAVTSNNDAIVSVLWENPLEPPALGHIDYWTKDGGAHWYATSVFQGLSQLAYLPVARAPYGETVLAVGNFQGEAATFQLSGWPVRVRVHCNGKWQGVANWRAYRPNVCTGTPQDAHMSVQRVS